MQLKVAGKCRSQLQSYIAKVIFKIKNRPCKIENKKKSLWGCPHKSFNVSRDAKQTSSHCHVRKFVKHVSNSYSVYSKYVFK